MGVAFDGIVPGLSRLSRLVKPCKPFISLSLSSTSLSPSIHTPPLQVFSALSKLAISDTSPHNTRNIDPFALTAAALAHLHQWAQTNRSFPWSSSTPGPSPQSTDSDPESISERAMSLRDGLSHLVHRSRGALNSFLGMGVGHDETATAAAGMDGLGKWSSGFGFGHGFLDGELLGWSVQPAYRTALFWIAILLVFMIIGQSSTCHRPFGENGS